MTLSTLRLAWPLQTAGSCVNPAPLHTGASQGCAHGRGSVHAEVPLHAWPGGVCREGGLGTGEEDRVCFLEDGVKVKQTRSAPREDRRGWGMEGGLLEADGQKGGKKDYPQVPQPGPQDTVSGSNRLLSCPATAAKRFRDKYRL